MSSYKPASKHEKKNVFQSTTNKPLRFAILGPRKSSKSSFVSIIANDISLENYYPTIQNSPILLQFQPKRETSRALLDVNVTLADLKQLHLLDSKEVYGAGPEDDCRIEISNRLIKRINRKHIEKLKRRKTSGHLGDSLAEEESSEHVLAATHHYYDLDYTNPDLFRHEAFSPLSSFHSPIAGVSRGESFGNSFNNSAGRKFPQMSGLSSWQDDGGWADREASVTGAGAPDSATRYRAPVTTPILVELIDTPGVQLDDIIPFLERSLDNRLSKDVLSNLANEYNTHFRSRVKPLITGSGISDLNAAVDGYLLFYSCVPEFENTEVDPSPPLYGADDPAGAGAGGRPKPASCAEERTEDSLEILASLHASIVDAWREYLAYHKSWEEGKEYDSLSLSSSIRQLWKSNNAAGASEGAPGCGPGTAFSGGAPSHPPIVVVCTHIDSPYAAPLLVSRGRALARSWGCSFIEANCSHGYAGDGWENVEEALSLLVREVL